eukprot:1196394-Prorocentrum_minimum.AAC.7
MLRVLPCQERQGCTQHPRDPSCSSGSCRIVCIQGLIRSEGRGRFDGKRRAESAPAGARP